ncbi:ABC transporter permease [Streptomyces cyslabdanicus]|uniref:ABC transporter permease n=1 Tax=Streptomyces cyslabdanicus TaxID=1470456 RepID=UPI004044BA8F
MSAAVPRRLARSLALPALLALAWVVTADAAHNIYVSTPQEIWDRAVLWWPDGWHQDLLPSVRNILLGFALSAVIGVGLGLAMGSSRTVRDLVTPTLDFLRAVPNAALVPCLLIVIGFSASTRVLVVFLSAVWPILLGTMDGVLSTDPRLRDVARAYRLPPPTRFLRLTLPAAGPHILAGMKTALSVSIVVVVISEMFGATEGLGHFIIDSQRHFDIAGVWLGTLVFGLLGYSLNSLYTVAQRRLLRWHPSTRIDA